MRVWWEPAIKRLIEAASPSVIVEIGTLKGATTAKLLEITQSSSCVVHTIDPSLGRAFDLAEFKERHGEHLVFHRKRSLDALPDIEAADVVLVDGDHNWYTVYHELELIGRRAVEAARDFPLTLLHDVEWPYGRRDKYFNPHAIPEAQRQPFKAGGMVPGRRELSDDGGVAPRGNNALLEGTPRNGVRTAVEDFVADSDFALHFRVLPGFSGLGILVSDSLLESKPKLRKALEEFDSPDWLREQCARIERGRVDLQARLRR